MQNDSTAPTVEMDIVDQNVADEIETVEVDPSDMKTVEMDAVDKQPVEPSESERLRIESAPLKFAAKTDTGLLREHNEDNYLVDRKLRLYVVCDGMGGHAAGEVASAVAVRTVSEEVRRSKDLLDDYLAKRTGGNKVSRRDILNMLAYAVNCASRKIHTEAVQDATKRGMGTTLVAVLFLGQEAFVLHVGDSRVYLLRNGSLEQLTEDHNVYNEFIKNKKGNLSQAAKGAPRQAITRAVGVYEHCQAEMLVMDVAPGDRFLLCTDGLSGYFEPPDGTSRELKALLSPPDIQGVVDELVRTANQRGGKDNITVVLVALDGRLDDDQTRIQRLEQQRKVLAESALFCSLNQRELRRVLEVTELATYGDGQVVVEEGMRGEQLYIVLSGEVEVERAGAPVARLSAGEHFGEMALIREQPRSATTRSFGPSELLVIHRKDFFHVLRSEHRLAVKVLWQFTGVLADRLAETTRSLGIARDELVGEDITCEIFGFDDEVITSELPDDK